MTNQYARSEILFGKEAMVKLRDSHVLVFGVGGVGGGVVEGLARSGVGTLTLVDNDTFSDTNLNRQLLAVHQTLGKSKVQVAAARVHDIDPTTTVHVRETFYLPEHAEEFDFSAYDYVVDAIDTVTAKIDIILRCQKIGTPILSCMGCGNRVDPSKLAIADIFKTSMDPLAKTMRRELKQRGVRRQKVLYSTEQPIIPFNRTENTIAQEAGKPRPKDVPGSTAFVPPAAGLLIASEVVCDLLEFDASTRTKGASAK